MSLAGFVGARSVDSSALLAPVELYAGHPGAQKGVQFLGDADFCTLKGRPLTPLHRTVGNKSLLN